MLPIGLQFNVFKTPKKLPMTLESGSMEDLKRHLYKIVNLECPNEKKSNGKSNGNSKKKSKKNKTKKAKVK